MNTNTLTRRLPLWEHAYDTLMKEGLKHGDAIPTQRLEYLLGAKKDTMPFINGIIKLSSLLREHGMYLSEREQKKRGYIIFPPEKNVEQMRRQQKMGINLFKTALVLGSNTPLETLTADEKRLHLQVQSIISTRLSLLLRYRKAVLPPLQKPKAIAETSQEDGQ